VPIQSVTTRSQNKEKEKKEGSEPDELAANDAKIKQKSEKPREVVFVIENNSAKTVGVKRGISDDSYTEIVSGIEEGKEVVSGSYKAINRELDDGVKVKVDNVKKKPANVASK
jgi:HlyD family secretion protein